MDLEDSGGLGCSVVTISDLQNHEIGFDSGHWDYSHSNWGRWVSEPAKSVYAEGGIEKLLKDLKGYHTGIAVWADRTSNRSGGAKLAKHLIKHGYNVTESETYTNRNHKSRCKMWTFYFHDKPKVEKGAKSAGTNGREEKAEKKSSAKLRLAA